MKIVVNSKYSTVITRKDCLTNVYVKIMKPYEKRLSCIPKAIYKEAKVIFDNKVDKGQLSCVLYIQDE